MTKNETEETREHESLPTKSKGTAVNRNPDGRSWDDLQFHGRQGEWKVQYAVLQFGGFLGNWAPTTIRCLGAWNMTK